MVSIAAQRESNSRIVSALPSGLVGVFVGATSGIGETCLKQFAKHTLEPRLYFVGRNQQAADRILTDLEALNPSGNYTFIKSDVGLIKNVDDVCREIRSKETTINLLFLSQGTLIMGTKTQENLQTFSALQYYSRIRFILNLLPLLEKATSLRRVVSVFSAGWERPIVPDEALVSGALTPVPQLASMETLSFEVLAQKAPTVSFVHSHPGVVITNIMRGVGGSRWQFLVDGLVKIGGWLPFVSIPFEEAGERHVFLCTSSRYPAAEIDQRRNGNGVLFDVAMGSDGNRGSGAYTIRWDEESSGKYVLDLLMRMRKDGMRERVWEYVESEFVRITGTAAV